MVLSTTTFVDSVQSNRMLIREWTRINKLCRPKQEKQQIIRWDTSSHINKFVDQQDGSNNQIVVSVPTSTSGVVPNRQNAARQLYLLPSSAGPSQVLPQAISLHELFWRLFQICFLSMHCNDATRIYSIVITWS